LSSIEHDRIVLRIVCATWIRGKCVSIERKESTWKVNSMQENERSFWKTNIYYKTIVFDHCISCKDF
jgi:hypothetical protein